jgi:hypothetical protein
VSLWLPPTLAAALAHGGRLRTRLRAELDARRLEVHTLSGLSADEESGSPFAEGGGEPSWDAAARRDYTVALARVLVELLPDETVRGAIGTIGLGPHDRWDEATAKNGAAVLRSLSGGLADLAWRTGRAVRVGFHTAPGYAVDGPDATVTALGGVDKDRLGVRLDLDHVTRTWPDPAAGIATLTEAGLPIIEVRLTAGPGTRAEARRTALTALFGPAGPLTEYLTLAPATDDPAPDDPAPDRLAADLTSVRAELAALGLTPENEPCPAR